jgi:polyphenol oxidase
MSTAGNAADVGVLVPDWPAPERVRAAFTLRAGGVSAGSYSSLNIGSPVGDAATAVAENRRRVCKALHLPAEPAWVEQVHGIGVLDLAQAAEASHSTAAAQRPLPCADAVIARRRGDVCVVQVADCLPVLLAARDASAVAAAHAGWRGLAAGVLEATVSRLGLDPRQLLAWIGPGIGPKHFEVGEEVRRTFLVPDDAAADAFTANARGRWQCDLAALARRRLDRLGIRAVFGGGWCTYADPARFFSHRREAPCGRMAALIWLE